MQILQQDNSTASILIKDRPNLSYFHAIWPSILGAIVTLCREVEKLRGAIRIVSNVYLGILQSSTITVG